jgi:hypothetical protein
MAAKRVNLALFFVGGIALLFLVVSIVGFLIPPESLPAAISTPVSTFKNSAYLKTHKFTVTSNVEGHRILINYFEPFVRYSLANDMIKSVTINLVGDSDNFKSTLSDQGNDLIKYNFSSPLPEDMLSIDIYVSDYALTDRAQLNQLLSFAVLDIFNKVNISHAQKVPDFDTERATLENYLKPIRLSSIKNFPVSYK